MSHAKEGLHMPLYEYRCESDGTVLELIRPMADADAPVTDPEGKGRIFSRAMSSFQTGGGPRSTSLPMGAGGGSGGCCPCGKGAGKCSSGLN